VNKRIGWLLAFMVAIWSQWGSAQAPELIAYQGKLIQSNSLVNAEVSVVARIFTNRVGGSYVYANSNRLTVVDGVYSFYLGSNTTFGSLGSAFLNSETWLELTINGTTLQPRERMASAAYAMTATERDPLWSAVSNGVQTQLVTDRQNRIGGDASLSNSVNVLTAVDALQDAMTAQLMADKLDQSVFAASTNALWNSMADESSARAGADASLSNRISGLGFYDVNRSIVGVGITNEVNNTTVVRGSLYLDGGTMVMYRTAVGTGPWSVKAFAIDHPLDPQNRILRHYCVEGPEVWNLYAGNVVLRKGRAEVTLPDYYAALNKVGSEIYSLTPVGGRAEVWIQDEVRSNRFVIAGSQDVKVSWTLKVPRNDPACRQDLKQRPVEQLKSHLTPAQTEADRLQNTTPGR
jgi:hypothetical protein